MTGINFPMLMTVIRDAEFGSEEVPGGFLVVNPYCVLPYGIPKQILRREAKGGDPNHRSLISFDRLKSQVSFLLTFFAPMLIGFLRDTRSTFSKRR